jgi:hypothetical protein
VTLDSIPSPPSPLLLTASQPRVLDNFGESLFSHTVTVTAGF